MDLPVPYRATLIVGGTFGMEATASLRPRLCIILSVDIYFVLHVSHQSWVIIRIYHAYRRMASCASAKHLECRTAVVKKCDFVGLNLIFWVKNVEDSVFQVALPFQNRARLRSIIVIF